MEIGIDSFADKREGSDSVKAINNVIDRIIFADEVGLNSFGIGEHHRKEFLDSAPFMILSAAAAKTKKITPVVHAWGGPVAIMANYHVAFGCNGNLVEFPMIPYKLEPIMFGDQRVIKNGKLLRPEISGIGITMNDKIEKDFVEKLPGKKAIGDINDDSHIYTASEGAFCGIFYEGDEESLREVFIKSIKLSISF